MNRAINKNSDLKASLVNYMILQATVMTVSSISHRKNTSFPGYTPSHYPYINKGNHKFSSIQENTAQTVYKKSLKVIDNKKM